MITGRVELHVEISPRKLVILDATTLKHDRPLDILESDGIELLEPGTVLRAEKPTTDHAEGSYPPPPETDLETER